MSDPGAGPALLRGVIFEARFEFLRALPTQGEVLRVLRSLDEADQETLREVARTGWYPFSTLVRLDRAIASALAPEGPRVFEQLGAASARLQTQWLGEHASLVSPHALLGTVAEEHRRFHSFGRADYRRAGFHEGVISFFDYPEHDESYCLVVKGYLRASLQLLSGGPVGVEERLCRCRGDAACVYVVGWDDRPGSGGGGGPGPLKPPQPSRAGPGDPE